MTNVELRVTDGQTGVGQVEADLHAAGKGSLAGCFQTRGGEN